jgi:hypothetical protein
LPLKVNSLVGIDRAPDSLALAAGIGALQRISRRHGHQRTRFRMYVAVDLALVVDVLPDKDNAAKDLGVFDMAGALPFSIAPGIAPAIRAVGSGSYGVLYGVAGVSAIIGAVAILPVRRVR